MITISDVDNNIKNLVTKRRKINICLMNYGRIIIAEIDNKKVDEKETETNAGIYMI